MGCLDRTRRQRGVDNDSSIGTSFAAEKRYDYDVQGQNRTGARGEYLSVSEACFDNKSCRTIDECRLRSAGPFAMSAD